MRAFIAIDLPQSAKQAIAHVQSRLRPALPQEARNSGDIRWVRPESVHLTLQFLGEITDEQATVVTATLRSLPPPGIFRIEMKGFGFFPNSHRPRVLWLGVNAPAALASLAAEIGSILEPQGFPKEDHPFAPHLTLARFRTPKAEPALEAALQELHEVMLGSFDASGYFLFESVLAPGAPPFYRKVASFGQLDSSFTPSHRELP